jgi:hypothetical protein
VVRIGGGILSSPFFIVYEPYKKNDKPDEQVYNGNAMKKVILFILMVVFFANTVVVSAWAKSCLVNDFIQMSQNMDASLSGDIPCHDNQNEQKNTHCDGICLCVHVSVSQAFITNDDVLNIPVIAHDRFVSENETISARATYPPHRPPISHS